jgi:hypothetical protein
MECVHLDLWVVPVSNAKMSICKKVGRSYGRSFYSPTIFQLQEYCRKNEHARCPFYLRNEEDQSVEAIIPASSQSGGPKTNIAR